MSNAKFSGLWALTGVAIALIAFSFNYFMVPKTLWGYDMLVAPAMFALQFFTEELAFTPKMLVFLSGQYLGYFLLIWSGKVLLSLRAKN